MSKEKILEVNGLSKSFTGKNNAIFGKRPKSVKAVEQVTFSLYQGETLGIVGESGCGKSTTARMIMGLLKPTEGQIHFHGQNVHSADTSKRKELSRNIQMVFQDPFGSLNPRHNVETILSEPFIIHQQGLSKPLLRQAVVELLAMIGLDESALEKYPHEFSGGQRQRINIARAIALRPDIVICDESVSALDVSIQAQILNLLKKLQAELQLTYLFVSHDLGVVRYISDRIAVMYLGQIVEMGECNAIYQHPKHPYTQLLFSAIPAVSPADKKINKKIKNIELSNKNTAGGGCAFYTRCDQAQEKCHQPPPIIECDDGRHVACHLYSHSV